MASELRSRRRIIESDDETGEDGTQQENQEDRNYGDLQRMILQGMMTAGILDNKGVKALFISVFDRLKMEHEVRGEFFTKVISEINKKIQSFDMQIKSGQCELTGKTFYMFVISNVENPIAQLQSLLSKGELELMNLVLHHILTTSPNFFLSTTECINLSSKLKINKMTMTQAEDAIEKFLHLKYFVKHQSEVERELGITLGIRGIREMEAVLNDLYSDAVTKCSLCKKMLLHGCLCPAQGCNTVVHKTCFKHYCAGSKDKKYSCPDCRGQWTSVYDDMILRKNPMKATPEESPSPSANTDDDNDDSTQ